MSVERKPELHLEIAHVLFIDVVGFSKLLINDQTEILCPDAILILGWLFTWIATVSADDSGASGSGIGPTGPRPEGGAAVFATTHSRTVLEAQGESPAAHDALEELCRTYWRPVYAFLRRQ